MIGRSFYAPQGHLEQLEHRWSVDLLRNKCSSSVTAVVQGADLGSVCVRVCASARAAGKGVRIMKFLFLLIARHQVRYLLEWTEDDLDDVEDAISTVDLKFCHPLCQCPKCAPAQVWLCLCLWGSMGWEASSFILPRKSFALSNS